MKFTLSGRIPSKKNSKRIVMMGHRPGIISSKDYEAWHTVAMYELKMQMPKNLILTGPSKVTIDLWAPTAQKGDLTNKAESIMDLMVDMSVIPDDNWVEVPQVILNFKGIDRTNPRAEVTIDAIPIGKTKVATSKNDHV